MTVNLIHILFSGDLNSDGLDDILIGAYGFDPRLVVAVSM